MATTRFFIFFIFVSLECFGQNSFERTKRYILSLENRSYYDSAEYNLFRLGTAMSRGVNFEMQWNFSPKLSWNNELQFVKFYPDKKNRNILDVAGLATKVKGYWYANDERYDGQKHWFNPYAQYGFVLTRILTAPSKQFVSMVTAIGTEMYSTRLYRTFAQVNYSLGLGTEAKNFVSFQMGGSYNFDAKNREKNYQLQKQNEKKLAQIELDYEQYTMKAVKDSIEKRLLVSKLNEELNDANQFADSMSFKNKELAKALNNCDDSYKLKNDSLQIVTGVLSEIYLKQWQNFEWVQQDTAIKSKNGFFAVAVQTFDLKELELKRAENNLTFPFAIIKNKYHAYRLLYYIGNTMNNTFDDNFNLVLEHFPLAEIVKLEDF